MKSPASLPFCLFLLVFLLAPLLAAPTRAADDATTAAEIGYLLDFVATSGCTFIRNGSRNDPEAAADHLRLKYSNGKRYVDSAEQFIDRLASESSWSGKPYTVECQGTIEPSQAWLNRALADYRQQPAEVGVEVD